MYPAGLAVTCPGQPYDAPDADNVRSPPSVPGAIAESVPWLFSFHQPSAAMFPSGGRVSISNAGLTGPTLPARSTARTYSVTAAVVNGANVIDAVLVVLPICLAAAIAVVKHSGRGATVGYCGGGAHIHARPETVWHILTDYREGHPSIPPPQAFSDFQVESGGKGAVLVTVTDGMISIRPERRLLDSVR